MVRMAKSRRPTAVLRSQLASKAVTCRRSMPLGSEARRQLGPDGTAQANSGARPSTWRKRSRLRSRVSPHLAEPGTRSERSRNTNCVTSSGDIAARSTSPSVPGALSHKPPSEADVPLHCGAGKAALLDQESGIVRQQSLDSIDGLARSDRRDTQAP